MTGAPVTDGIRGLQKEIIALAAELGDTQTLLAELAEQRGNATAMRARIEAALEVLDVETPIDLDGRAARRVKDRLRAALSGE